MRLQHALLAGLVALSCAEHIGIRHGLRARQDNAPSTTRDAQPSTNAINPSSATSTPTQPPSKTRDDSGSATATNTQSEDSTATSSTGTATQSVPSPSSTIVLPGGNSTTDGNTLPIQPKLNAPLGVGGVILIITGLVLGLVGIKHRATQTFLSTSLLVALGCEVLVVYLMHPPVPVAIQGAYLIAGVVGGFLLGGLALIFKEMSEGFGCVLGGFCLAMWLLVLKPGGLITNNVGKIVLIAMLCAGCYSSYISRFTRVYGLIFCTAFAGSTAFILGVDCFSNAGLKEFWLYIWNLNDDEFPLFTDSYPITRNMRVEIAAIVIVAFIGTMSQIKIWQIVKEQKAKRDAQRIADEEARDIEEAEVGRDVENRNRESLKHWEGNYDGKKGPSIEVESMGVSLEDLSSNGAGDRRNRESKRFSFLKQQSSSSLNLQLLGPDYKRASAAPSLPPLSFGFGDEESTREAHATTAPTTPRTEPPSPGIGSTVAPVTERRGLGVKRLSRMSLNAVKRLSMMSLNAKEAMEAADDDAPFDPEEDDDLASSIAATAADPPDLDALSVRLSRPNSMYLSHAAGTSPLQTQEQFIEDDDEEALWPTGGTSPGLPKSPGAPGIPGKGAEPGEKVALEDRLPKKVSRAASTYRTNEWAKEVSRAEPEPIEETLEHDSDAVRIEMGNAADSARADENNAAPKPPTPPPPPPAPKVAKVRSSTHLSRTPSALAPTPVYAHDHKDSTDSWSEPLAKRASSGPTLSVSPQIHDPMPQISRNFSTPMLDRAVVQSPLDERPKSRPNSRPSSAMPKQANLMDERRERLEKRLTTTSFIMPTPGLGITPSTSDASGKGQSSHEGSQTDNTELSAHSMPENEEDMTLAERKALVQQQAALQAQNADFAARPLNSRHASQITLSGFQPETLNRSSTQPQPPKPVHLSTGGTHQPLYDSHQPRRKSTHDSRKQAGNWNQWRSSNVVATVSRNPYVIGDNQMDMLRAVRVQSETEAKMREQQKIAIQEQIDAHMRMGGMNDAHRKAMAKMQGKANKSVG